MLSWPNWMLMDDNDSDEDQEITHSVPFKCIGAAHEKNYQHHLEPIHWIQVQLVLIWTLGLVHLMLDILLQKFANICTPLWLQEILSMLMFSILSIGRLF